MRGKLSAGVQESRDAIQSGREQIRSSEEQVKHAAEAYKLSKERLENKVQGSSTSEVMQTIRGLQAAHLAYLTSVRDYDQAQLRLMMLLGPANCGTVMPILTPAPSASKCEKNGPTNVQMLPPVASK